MKMKAARKNRVNNINTLILKNYWEAMTSVNADKWVDAINKELTKIYIEIMLWKYSKKGIEPLDVKWSFYN